MQFFEDGDFTNFDDDEEEVDVLHCHECDTDFEVAAGAEPTECPACGIEFIQET